MRRSPDTLTGDLFEVPKPRTPMPGALSIDPVLRALLSDLLKKCPFSRFQVVARMSELTGQEITKHQLDSWTAESRNGWRFPLEYLPAFEVAVQTHDVTAWMAGLRGCKVLVGKEALEAQLGKLGRMKAELAEEEKAIKDYMRRMK